MERVSMGDILDQTVKRKATTAEIYILHKEQVERCCTLVSPALFMIV